MKVTFEVRKSKPQEVNAGEGVGTGNTADIAKSAEEKKQANQVEKERLQSILKDADVEFSGTLGVKKLQILVDGINPAE